MLIFNIIIIFVFELTQQQQQQQKIVFNRLIYISSFHYDYITTINYYNKFDIMVINKDYKI